MVASAADPMAATAVGIDVRRTRVIAMAARLRAGRPRRAADRADHAGGRHDRRGADAQGVHGAILGGLEQHARRGDRRAAARDLRDARSVARSPTRTATRSSSRADRGPAVPAAGHLRSEGAGGMSTLAESVRTHRPASGADRARRAGRPDRRLRQDNLLLSGGGVVLGALVFCLAGGQRVPADRRDQRRDLRASLRWDSRSWSGRPGSSRSAKPASWRSAATPSPTPR